MTHSGELGCKAESSLEKKIGKICLQRELLLHNSILPISISKNGCYDDGLDGT